MKLNVGHLNISPIENIIKRLRQEKNPDDMLSIVRTTTEKTCERQFDMNKTNEELIVSNEKDQEKEKQPCECGKCSEGSVFGNRIYCNRDGRFRLAGDGCGCQHFSLK